MAMDKLLQNMKRAPALAVWLASGAVVCGCAMLHAPKPQPAMKTVAPVISEPGNQERPPASLPEKAERAKAEMQEGREREARAPGRNTATERHRKAAARPAEDSARTHVDLETLKHRLEQTPVIGVFTKLAIRGDILDLKHDIEQARQRHQFQARIKEFRERFDGLLMKIVTLVQQDEPLSRDLYTAREALWHSLLEVGA